MTQAKKFFFVTHEVKATAFNLQVAYRAELWVVFDADQVTQFATLQRTSKRDFRRSKSSSDITGKVTCGLRTSVRCSKFSFSTLSHSSLYV